MKTDPSYDGNDTMRDALVQAGAVTFPIPDMLDAIALSHPETAAARAVRRRQARTKTGKPVNKEPSKRNCQSLGPIARLLDCEGFDEYAAGMVLRYANHQVLKSGDLDKARAAFKDAMKTAAPHLTAEQKRCIGFFIHLCGRASFESGLRMGLMSYVTLSEATCHSRATEAKTGERLGMLPQRAEGA